MKDTGTVLKMRGVPTSKLCTSSKETGRNVRINDNEYNMLLVVIPTIVYTLTSAPPARSPAAPVDKASVIPR